MNVRAKGITAAAAPTKAKASNAITVTAMAHIGHLNARIHQDKAIMDEEVDHVETPGILI